MKTYQAIRAVMRVDVLETESFAKVWREICPAKGHSQTDFQEKLMLIKLQVRGEAEILRIPIDSPPSLHHTHSAPPDGNPSKTLECGWYS
jgi:hypothetical protein